MDAERIRREDEEEEEEEEEGARGSGSGGSESDDEDDKEVEGVFVQEERKLVAEAIGVLDPGVDEEEDGEEEDEEESDSGDSDEEDQSPRRGFQARLERVRQRSKGKQVADSPIALADEDEEMSGEDDFDKVFTWDDDDDDELGLIQDLIDENPELLEGRNRKERRRLFRAIQNGDEDFLEALFPIAKRKKDKGKDLPPALQEQWAKDRAKKAAYKQERAQARLEAAVDPLVPKKGGKKGRKATLAAARLDPSIEVPNQVFSLITLEQQIRRFLADLGGRDVMSLPPCDKETRKAVHELALAFNLKSQSKGKGQNRYTTLRKTTKSGFGINEGKVARILRRERGGGGGGGGWNGNDGWKGKGTAQMPRHREGDEVGKAAPKIDGSNIGFQMLASMGWSEGERIGLTGGLEAPLAAVYKKTKLGLGASL
ncbi:hypothetical protein JAAARDRAFT_133277 [Jaapia argillacea MUCL 33604]|uniref:Protein SQS1 n=1 Tax=Jaapia argillacea MUCL 33604 TaxID=933084 RepID=A0A067PPC1_9AGAM|nr:hypothetical protein JAAARDRAFT_133277 [Jaapia argillacea MUCL 33604]